MKRLIVLAIILLWAGQAWAGERSPAPPPTRAIPIIRPMPIPPDPFKDISNCPWHIKAVPEAEAEKLMNEGWEPFGVGSEEYKAWDPPEGKWQKRVTKLKNMIYLRRKVCE